MRRRSTTGVVSRNRTTNNVVRTNRTTGRKKRRRRKNRRRASAPVVDPVRQANYSHRAMVDKGEMEKPNTDLNERKIKFKWTGIMSKLKTRSLRSELERVRNGHERRYELRNQKTDELMKNLKMVDEQSREAQDHHEAQLDSLTKFQAKRIDILEKEFKRELSSLIDEYEDELNEIEVSGETAMEELDDIQSTMKHRHETHTEQLENQGDMDLYFVQKRYHQDIYVMKKALKERVEDLQDTIDKEAEIRGGRVKRVYKNYIKLRSEYDGLVSKNRADRVRVHKLTNLLNFWKAKWLHHVRESHIRNERLNEEVVAIRAAFRSLKRKMENFQKDEDRKLVRLVKISNVCDKKLKGDIQLGESVLQAQRLIEEMETYKDRMGGQTVEMGDPDEEEFLDESETTGGGQFNRAMSIDLLLKKGFDPMKVGDEFLKNHEEQKHKEIKKQVKTLEPFFIKMNNVKLDNEALDLEQKRLNQENRRLKKILRNYIDGISVNERVLNKKNNPLMIVQPCRVGVNVHAAAQGLKHR